MALARGSTLVFRIQDLVEAANAEGHAIPASATGFQLYQAHENASGFYDLTIFAPSNDAVAISFTAPPDDPAT